MKPVVNGWGSWALAAGAPTSAAARATTRLARRARRASGTAAGEKRGSHGRDRGRGEKDREPRAHAAGGVAVQRVGRRGQARVAPGAGVAQLAVLAGSALLGQGRDAIAVGALAGQLLARLDVELRLR